MNPAIMVSIEHWFEEQYDKARGLLWDLEDWNERCDSIPLLATCIVVVIGVAAAIVFFGPMCYTGAYPR